MWVPTILQGGTWGDAENGHDGEEGRRGKKRAGPRVGGGDSGMA